MKSVLLEEAFARVFSVSTGVRTSYLAYNHPGVLQYVDSILPPFIMLYATRAHHEVLIQSKPLRMSHSSKSMAGVL